MAKVSVRPSAVTWVLVGAALLLVILGACATPRSTTARIDAASAETTTTSQPTGPLSPAQEATAPPVSISPIPASGGSPIDGATAAKEVASGSSITSVTATYAKSTTWGDYLSNAEPGLALPQQAGLTPENSVIVAAAVGVVECDCSMTVQAPYAWRMAVYDQQSGALLTYWLGRGALPAWYLTLPNAG
jgi:hypothetical protein